MGLFTDRPRIAGLIFAGAAALYIFYSKYYFVGNAFDDAYFVNAARSLLQGHYRELSAPRPVPISYFLPGYPLFLAPWVAWIAPHWAWLKVVSILVTLASGLLFLRLTGPWFKPSVQWILTAAVLVHPIVAYMSPWVMSEGFFTCLALLSFILLSQSIESNKRPGFIYLGLVLGWAIIVRPIGWTLFFGIALALLVFGTRRQFFWTVLPSLALWGISSALLTGHKDSPHHYSELAHQSAAYLSGNIHALLDNWSRITNLFFVSTPWSIHLPYSALGITCSLILAAIVMALLWAGTQELAEQSRASRTVAIALAVFLGGYYAVHCVWAAIDARYAKPIWPFFVILTAAGIVRIAKVSGRRWVMPAGVVILFLTLLWGNILQAKRVIVHARSPVNRYPREMLAWIDEHVPMNACLLAPRIGFLHLYTGRHGYSSLTDDAPPDRETFRYQVLANGITHVFGETIHPLIRPRKTIQPMALVNQQVRWAASWPAAFRVVYANVAEGETVFEAVPDAAFVGAFQKYLAGKAALDRGETEKALILLRSALKADSTMAKALNAYGFALLKSGRQLDEAERNFKAAIQSDPDYLFAYVNLIRLYNLEGQSRQEAKLREELDRRAKDMIR